MLTQFCRVLSGGGGGLCELDRVSEGGDTAESVVGTVVSFADTDGESRGDIVMSVDDKSFSGGGDAVVPGVDTMCLVLTSL